jgi:hypothetical protein
MPPKARSEFNFFSLSSLSPPSRGADGAAPSRPGCRHFSLRRNKFNGMEVDFGGFPWHGSQIVRFFHGMEATF